VSDVDKLMTEILGEQPNVKDKALRELVMARMKAGGEVRMGKGGLIKSLVKAIAKELPEAKASQKTQIRGTEPTYRKAYDILEREKPGGRTLDYGAGLGHGSKLMGAESFEPFPREGFRPTFIRPEDIPTEEFDRLVNLNVLNVMPREVRDATVENIGRVMRPGGMGIVTTRGRDVLNAAGEAGSEPMSKITSIGTYQKGFTPEELREYLEYILGRDYSVSKLGLGPAGATIKKKANGGAVLMKRGGKAKGETLASMDTGKVEMGRAPGAEKAEKILSGAAEFIPGVAAGKSALEGEYQKALIEAGLDVAGGSLVKGAAALGGKAIPALAGIFIGEHARVWNKAAAKEFKKLEKAGVSNKDAFEKTGTFRSPDGELRQEISDRSSRLKGEKLRDINEALQLNVDAPQKAKLEKMHADIFDQMKSSGTDAPISELIYHPELFKAYPELESLRGRYNIIPSMPETGYYNLGSPTMPPKLSAEGPTAESARSSMLHEIQHAIQHLEGFGMGGNPEMGMTMLPRSMDPVDYLNQLRKSKINLLDEQARLAKEFKESGAQYTLDNPLVKKSIELPNKIDDVDQAIEGIVQGYFYPMYKRMAGEAESRAVQARRQMSPQQLQDVFPLSSYDVPIDQLIVKRQPYAEGGPVKMADGGGIGKNVGRGMAGLTRSRQPLDPKEIQAMFLDVPAGLGVPFAEAGAYALRGETDEAKESAAIEAALIGVPGAAVLAKPAYRAVKKGVQKAAPAVREAARGALESSMESGLIQGPLYAVKPSGGQWLGGRKGDPQQIGVPNAPAPIDPETIRSYKERLDESRQRLQEYQEMTGMEPTQEMADRVRNLERGVEGIERGEAVRRWVDSNLDNYVRKQMGTPDDPVRKLADQGILHMPQLDVTLMKLVANQREAAGFPREGFATTDLGRMWETLTDSGIKQIEAGKLRDPEYMLDIGRRFRDEEKNFGRPGAIPEENRLTAQQAGEVRNFASATTAQGWDSLMRNNPWLEKVDLETPIYSVPRWMKDNVSRSLGFDHIVDVLKADLASGRMRPEQLSKMSMEQAVRRTNEYDVERAAAMAKAAEEETAGLTVAKTFEDGFKIVKLDKPGQFAKESDRMGHSVRGYEPERGSKEWSEASGVEGSSLYGHGGWDAIKSGNAQVFSIRDAKNQPHVTIEVSREADPSMNEMQRFIDSIEDPAVRETVERRLQYTQTSGDYSDPEWRMATILRYGGREGPDGQWVEGAIPGYKEFKESIPERITQIKGKQNRKPDEKYLPYVQKFIREGNYKVEGDLSNTELVDTKNLSQYAYKTSDLGLNYDEFKKMLNLSKDIPRYITESELLRTAKTGKFEPEFKKGGKVKTKRSALSSLERAK